MARGFPDRHLAGDPGLVVVLEEYRRIVDHVAPAIADHTDRPHSLGGLGEEFLLIFLVCEIAFDSPGLSQLVCYRDGGVGRFPFEFGDRYERRAKFLLFEPARPFVILRRRGTMNCRELDLGVNHRRVDEAEHRAGDKKRNNVHGSLPVRRHWNSISFRWRCIDVP